MLSHVISNVELDNNSNGIRHYLLIREITQHISLKPDVILFTHPVSK